MLTTFSPFPAATENDRCPTNDALESPGPAMTPAERSADTIPAPPPVAACSCGRTFDATEWEALPSRRLWIFAVDDVLEIAECSCGSTTAVVVAAPEAA